MDGKNVVAGVNADFFNLSTGEPEGLFVKNGITVHNWYPTVEISSNRMNYRTFFGILDDGSAIIGDKNVYNEYKNRIQQAVGGDYILVKDGTVRSFEDEDTDNMNDLPVSPYSRTCIGIREDGSVLIIVVDGSSTNGLSLVEVAQIMVENGAMIAMNFDGGGSSTMVIKDSQTCEYTVKNTSSDGSERAVGNCLYIYSEMPLEKDADGYYLIESINELALINDNPYANYRLKKDLHIEKDTEVLSINTFYGKFDGQGYIINGWESSYPLFKVLNPGAVVENLSVVNARIEEDDFANVAIIAGTCDGAVIRNVNVHGAIIKKTDGATAGVVAELKSSLGATGQYYITNCYANVDISAPYGNGVGGIFGNTSTSGTYGIISGCTAEGTVKGYRYVGGIGGRVQDSNNVWVDQNVVNGVKIEGEIHVGGVVGMGKCFIQKCLVEDVNIVQTSTTIQSKFAASFITSWHSYQYAKVRFNTVLNGAIQTTYEDGSYNIADGLYSEVRTKNYVSGNTRINDQFKMDSDEGYHGILVTEEELSLQSFYKDKVKYNFDELDGVWNWDNEHNRPVIKNMPVHALGVTLDKTEITIKEGESIILNAVVSPRKSIDHNVTWISSNSEIATVEDGVVMAVGAGDVIITVTTADELYTASCSITVDGCLHRDDDGYYLIRNIKDFEKINDDLYEKYRLANNLEISEIVNLSIDNFYGEFDGQNYIISGYTSSYPLFKNLKPGAIVENLSVVNALIEEEDFNFVAIVAGTCDGATIRNVKAEGTVIQKSTTGICGAAGIVAYLESSSEAFLVENCSAQVVINATTRGYCGAIFGETAQDANGIIRACLATNSNITGKNFVGTIGGRMLECSDMWVEDCMAYNVGVNAEIHAGGVVGMAKGGVRRCFVENVNIIQQSNTRQAQYSASFVSSWHNYANLSYENNVIYSGSISTTYEEGSYNVADGEIGNRINNYVSNNLKINGAFKTGDNNKYHGIVVSMDELSQQTFYENAGFDFSDNGFWKWVEGKPALKISNIMLVD